MIFSVKKLFAQWYLNNFFLTCCDFLQIAFFYAIYNVQSMFRNVSIHSRRIVFSREFFETDWVESTQCDYRKILQ